MKKNRWTCLLLLLALTVAAVGCTNATITDNDGKETEETADNTTDTHAFETDPPESSADVPEQWHVFEYDGIKYDLWEISSLVNAVSEWRHIGKYVIAEGHVNPHNSIFAVINTETQTIEHHFSGSVPTCHSDDINTLVYAFWNNVLAYDGTLLASMTMQNGEYIRELAYSDDKTQIIVSIETSDSMQTEIIDLKPSDDNPGMTEYIAELSLEDERDFITVAGVYGRNIEPRYPDGATIHAGNDGTLYYVMGVGNEWWSSGNFKALRTYRVTSKGGYIESVEEVETFTKDKVLKDGKPYTGNLDGMFTCCAYRFKQGNFNYDFLHHSIYMQSDGTIYANSGLVGTGGPMGYEGTYQYDEKTGDFTAKLVGRYANEGEVTIYPEAEVKGKLYEYGGFVHFVCESSSIPSLTVNDPLPLTFVPNTDGYADPEPIVLDEVFNGVWEYIDTENGEECHYRISISTQSAEIQLEDVINGRRYVGTYTVNSLTMTQAAKLRSLNSSEKESEFTMKFSLGYSRGTTGTFLFFDVMSCDAPSYQHLAGKMLGMHQVTDDSIIHAFAGWTQYTEVLNADNGNAYQVSFSIPNEWGIPADDKSGNILHDSDSKKRIGERVIQSNQTFDAFTESILSDPSGNGVVKNPDTPYSGVTDSGIEYIGYHVSVFPSSEQYKYLLKFTDDLSMHISISMHNDDDYADFYNEIILPILNSVSIYVIAENSDDELALRYKAFSGIVGFTPGDGSVFAERSNELAAATDAFFKEYENDKASSPPILYYLVQKMGLTKSDMRDYYSPNVPPTFIDALFIEDMEEAKRALMTDYSFYANGKVYTFYEVYNAETAGKPLFDITESDHAATWWNIYDYLLFQKARDEHGYAHSPYSEYLPYIEEILGENFTTITDIADWERLGLSKEYNGTYSFLWNLLGGESDIPEYNGLGIKDYSLTRIFELNSVGTTVEFTFTVTGNSLPETLPPGIYTKIVRETVDVFLDDTMKPKTKGLDKFGHIPAVQAVDAYLTMMSWELSPYGEWDLSNGYLPSNYICKFYGDEDMEIGFDEMQKLLSEKFGITIDKPTEDHWFYRCMYTQAADTVRYADTRGYEAVHRVIDAKTENGITYVTVQLFSDRLYLIPSHKVVYKIGADEVFLGCEIIETGNYDPRELS
ncbi:MAG: hypothetical protein IJF49_06455 [Clostridia bacterium]|nr:hypothetical protein [Clostridia bacterium]